MKKALSLKENTTSLKGGVFKKYILVMITSYLASRRHPLEVQGDYLP